MSSGSSVRKIVVVVAFATVIAACGRLVWCEDRAKEPVIRLEKVPPEWYEQDCVDAVGKAVGFQDWPRTDVYRVVPTLKKFLLGNPGAVTDEDTVYGASSIGKAACSRVRWWARRTVPTGKPLPTELPPKEMERVQKRLATLPERLRNNPEYVEKLIKRRLEKYIESRMYRVEGRLDVEIRAVPNSQMAQELMLLDMIASTMPTEGIVATCARAERPEGLGTVSFVNEYAGGEDVRIKLTRDNIFVEIHGQNVLAQEALPLARKIDGLLKAKAFTKTQLSARRPVIKMASKAVKRKNKGERWISFETTVPPDTRVVYKRASVDGEDAAVIGKAVRIVGRTSGKAKVALTVMTEELVSATVEQDVLIEE